MNFGRFRLSQMLACFLFQEKRKEGIFLKVWGTNWLSNGWAGSCQSAVPGILGLLCAIKC
jgi:hypothetical protein